MSEAKTRGSSPLFPLRSTKGAYEPLSMGQNDACGGHMSPFRWAKMTHAIIVSMFPILLYSSFFT
jgi:hypothetical protein